MTVFQKPEPWTTLLQLAGAGKRRELEALVEAIGPQETLRSLLRLQPDERERVLTTLSPSGAADIMEDIPDERASQIIEELSPDDAAPIVTEMRSAGSPSHVVPPSQQVPSR